MEAVSQIAAGIAGPGEHVTLRQLLDILIPRFITEDAAAELERCEHCDGPHYFPVCALADVKPGEVFDGIITIRGFNLFGWVLFSRLVGDPRPFVNPHDLPRP